MSDPFSPRPAANAFTDAQAFDTLAARPPAGFDAPRDEPQGFGAPRPVPQTFGAPGHIPAEFDAYPPVRDAAQARTPEDEFKPQQQQQKGFLGSVVDTVSYPFTGGKKQEGTQPVGEQKSVAVKAGEGVTKGIEYVTGTASWGFNKVAEGVGATKNMVTDTATAVQRGVRNATVDAAGHVEYAAKSVKGSLAPEEPSSGTAGRQPPKF